MRARLLFTEMVSRGRNFLRILPLGLLLVSVFVSPAYSLTLTEGEGIDISSDGTNVTVAGENATTSNKGIASFNSTYFSVSSGAVSLNAATLADLVEGTTAYAWGNHASQNYFDKDTDDISDISALMSESGTAINLRGSAVINDDAIDSFAELQAIVADKTLANAEDAVTWSSLQTMSDSLSIEKDLTVSGLASPSDTVYVAVVDSSGHFGKSAVAYPAAGNSEGVFTSTADGAYLDGDVTITGTLTADGDIYANKLHGDGSLLTGISAGSGNFTGLTLDGDSGTPQELTNGDTIKINGGTGIDTDVGPSDELTLNVSSDVHMDSEVTPTGAIASGSSNLVTAGTVYAAGYQNAADVTTYCENTQDYLKTSENNDSADDVSLSDVQGACSNDFHVIGGTDANTTYTANGYGIRLIGTDFSLDPDLTASVTNISTKLATGAQIYTFCETTQGYYNAGDAISVGSITSSSAYVQALKSMYVSGDLTAGTVFLDALEFSGPVNFDNVNSLSATGVTCADLTATGCLSQSGVTYIATIDANGVFGKSALPYPQTDGAGSGGSSFDYISESSSPNIVHIAADLSVSNDVTVVGRVTANEMVFTGTSVISATNVTEELQFQVDSTEIMGLSTTGVTTSVDATFEGDMTIVGDLSIDGSASPSGVSYFPLVDASGKFIGKAALAYPTTDGAEAGFSGSYNDLTDKPYIPSFPADISSDDTVTGNLDEDHLADGTSTDPFTFANLDTTDLTISGVASPSGAVYYAVVDANGMVGKSATAFGGQVAGGGESEWSDSGTVLTTLDAGRDVAIDGDLSVDGIVYGQEQSFTLCTDGMLSVNVTEGQVVYNDTGDVLIIQDASASAGLSPTGAALQINVRKNGAVITSTPIEIDAGTYVDDNNHVFSSAVINAGDAISFSIAQVGSTQAGGDVWCRVRCRRVRSS